MDAADRLRELSRRPIFVAPMAGGPSTPALVVAAAEAGALGFLAAGYKTVEAVRGEIDAVRSSTDGAFGVNVFVPQPPAADTGAVAAYLATLEVEAERLGTSVGEPSWDDDAWDAKLAALLAGAPPIVSFTFGCPAGDVVAAFHDRGALVAVTVTAAEEARAAASVGADCLCAQGSEAGAHRGTFANDDRAAQDRGLLTLLAELSRVTALPLIAAGGIGAPHDVADALRAGAVAVQAGTAFLRCPESGAHPVHKAALADPRFTTTAVTRAFSGRPARGLLNRFMLDHPDAPPAYPEINNATRPLRTAAANVGDPDRMSLWAGRGFRAASERPAGEIVERLAEGARRPSR